MTDVASGDRTIRFLGNNEARVLVSGEEADGAYCVMELLAQPGGGNKLHTDDFTETFHVIEGDVEWTVQEDDGSLRTWRTGPGETVILPKGSKHSWAGAGDGPSRILAIGTPAWEAFFRALEEAWPGPYDREATPAAVGPVFERYGVHFYDR